MGSRRLTAQVETLSRFLAGSDRRLLTTILISKFLWMLAALMVVAHVTPLRDSELYLSWSLGNFSGVARTAIVGNIAAALKLAVFGRDWAVHTIFSLVAGLAVWGLLRGRCFGAVSTMLLLALLAVPAFGIWGSIVGKEVFAVVFSAVFYRLLLDSLALRRIGAATAAGLLASLVAYGMIRPTYAIGMIWGLLVLAVLLATRGPRQRMLRLASIGAGIGLAGWAMSLIEIRRVLETLIMPMAKMYVLPYGDAHVNRTWLAFDGWRDFVGNLWWGVPFSIIGPLPSEVIDRPALLPVLIGGVMTLFLYVGCFVMAGRRCRNEPLERQFFWWGLIPGAAATLLAHYPLGILNPGSGIRYHVAFAVQFGFTMLALALPRREPSSAPSSDGAAPSWSRWRDRNGASTYRQGTPPLLARSGVLVGLATVAGYGGFVVRDILMARFFGLGEVIAQFQLAAFLPLFLAAILGGPLYSSLVPEMMRRREPVDVSWPGSVSTLVWRGFFAAGTLTWLISLGYAADSGVAGGFASFSLLALMMSLVLVFSGSVVTYNAILNSLGHPVATAVAQTASPAAAILVLIVGYRWGAFALAAGMLIGQLANLAWLRLLISRHGVALRSPRAGSQVPWPLDRVWLVQYLALVAVSLVLYAAQPMGVILAEQLGSTAVAAITLGGKTITMLNGLVWVTVAYVMLPHFSRIAASGDEAATCRELTRALAAGVAGAVPAALVLFLISPAIIGLLFEGGAFGSRDTALVGRLTAIGVLQLPYFTVAMVFVKHAVADRRVWRMLWALVLGLAGNLVVAMALLHEYGVVGIAGGGVAGVALGALGLLAGAAASGTLRIGDASLLILELGAFGGVALLLVEDRGAPIAAAVGLALAVLVGASRLRKSLAKRPC